MVISSRWAILLLGVLLATTVHCDDDIEDDIVDEGPVKEPFVPIKFVAPVLSGEANLWEFFGSRGAIGKTWIKSKAKKDDVDSEISKYNGEWEIGAPSEVSIDGDWGLIVRTKARHHAIAAKLNKPFRFGEDPLLLQYEVKFEEGQECGGGYVKLLSEGAEASLADFNDKTAYTIMFGPDKCSPSGRVHLIFRYRNPKNGTISEHHAKQPDNVAPSYWDDHRTHLYTLIVRPSGDFTVHVDNGRLFGGNMLTDLVPAIEPPKQIADPEDKKPEDWDERAEIEDETATKPEDWDENAPKEIVDEKAEMPADWKEDEDALTPDPTAKKPEDWDAEMDGEWEAPLIDNPACQGVSGCGKWTPPTIPNPAYKGKWRRPRIPNPAYKGIWSARLIDNPDHFEPKPFEGLAPVTAIGIELWTMSKNIIFDNVLIAEKEALGGEAMRLTFDVRRAEEARLRAATGGNDSIWQNIVDATKEKPWLWAVYVLCVLIPVVLLAVCCFGKKSSSVDDGIAKKTDLRTRDDEDDEVPLLADENGEPISRETAASQTDSPRKRKGAREQIEEDDNSEDDQGASGDNDEELEEEEEEPVPEPVKKVEKAATGVRSRRPKRAD